MASASSGRLMKTERGAQGPSGARATILVASDSPSDAALVRKLLSPEFDQVFLSTDPTLAVQDFDGRTPDVLVLAFNTLEKAASYSLGLYRLSSKIQLQAHRTVVLCNKEEVSQAYEACKKDHYDDYMLFWPMTNDSLRLPMSVHRALRDLSAVRNDQPSTAQMAALAHTLADMGGLMEQEMAQGGRRIEQANRAIEQAELQIGRVLDDFSNRVARGELPAASGTTIGAAVGREIQRLKQEEIGQGFRAVAASVRPITQWAAGLKKECQPHIESVLSLKAMADRIQPTVLVVDDDELQRKILGKLLVNYRLTFAGGGGEALNILRKTRPDLILMDIAMPDMDGIETTRRLKTMPHLANVPVIMVTGNSEAGAVRESMKAGASNFVVKPLNRDALLEKVAHALRSQSN
jgi:CheY-like chemotaxis protein